MTSEIEAAAERMERWGECCTRGDFGDHEYHEDEPLQRLDEGVLIDWALARLAADRSAVAEVHLDGRSVDQIAEHIVAAIEYGESKNSRQWTLRDGFVLGLREQYTLAVKILERAAADRAEREERARPIDADLLPCPCCGNAGPRKEPRMVDADDYGNKTETGVVFCRDCGLNMETCHGQQEAESRWNRRDLLRILKGGGE